MMAIGQMEVPTGLTAADVRHRLETWPGLRDACVAAQVYDRAINQRAGTGEFVIDAFAAIADGADLDSLYADWIGKASAALAAAEEQPR